MHNVWLITDAVQTYFICSSNYGLVGVDAWENFFTIFLLSDPNLFQSYVVTKHNFPCFSTLSRGPQHMLSVIFIDLLQLSSLAL